MIKVYFKVLVVLCLFNVLLSSCAIHKDFPYICLRWGCFAKQVGLPNGKEVKKQIQANAKVRNKKRGNKRKKNKGKNELSKYHSGVRKEEKFNNSGKSVFSHRNDTLTNTYSVVGTENYLIVVFKFGNQTEKDSIIIAFPETGDEISVFEKQKSKLFLTENKTKIIEKVIIKEFRENSLKGNSTVKKKLAEFLELEGELPEIIFIE